MMTQTTIKGILTSKIGTYLKTRNDALYDAGEWQTCEISYSSKVIDKKIPVWFVFYDHKNQLNRPFLWLISWKNQTKIPAFLILVFCIIHLT
jgi:hypothetical protein